MKNDELRREINRIALSVARAPREAFYRYFRRCRDRATQAMANNLWDNHPGELDRWADDGGGAA